MRPVSPQQITRHAWRALAAVGLAAGTFVVVATPAAASQFTVTTAADSGAGSLRQAVIDANANSGPDEIIFDPSINTQTILLTSGPLSVTEDLTVTGNGATNTIIDGNGTGGIFVHSGFGAFEVSGATLQHGATPVDGGAIDSDGAVTIDATTITGNSASYGGGGISAPDVTIRNGSVIRANHAGADGGGVASRRGAVTVTDSTIGGPTVPDGNTADGGSGAIGMDFDTNTMTIVNATVTHNVSASGSAALSSDGAYSHAGVLIVTDSTISSNVGNGVFAHGALTVSNSTVTANTGLGVISMSNQGSTLTIADSTVSLNEEGGALASGDATITDSLFDRNSSPFAGGGFFALARQPNSTISISDTTFSENQQTGAGFGGGGAIGIADASATLTNVTMTGNTALGNQGGGGILILTLGSTSSPEAVTIEASTIDGNSDGGIVVLNNAPVTSVGTTILSDSTGPACDGTISDAGFNLLFNTTAGSCVFDAANDVSDADPELSALTLNAPATLVPTMALSATSPALDVVRTGCPPPATDARGVTRPQGDACDVGAFELEVTPPPPTTTTATTTTTPTTPTTPTTISVAPAGTGESSGANGTLAATGFPGPGLALLGFTFLAVGALVECATRRSSSIRPRSRD